VADTAVALAEIAEISLIIAVIAKTNKVMSPTKVIRRIAIKA